ncbi:MAG: anti-sigma factor [Proteobacteria bacterium]|nr:anti-sigma factor [Pseudomonadota bacterium]MCP4921460.1 anti-sigma factor [Pseudomonadota bacterium]
MHHHVPENLLLDYTTGTATEAVALVVAGHLALCPECSERARLIEDVGGLLLESLDAEPMADGSLESLMARLDDPIPVPPAPPVVPSFLAEVPLPSALHHYVDGATGWRRVLPGIKTVQLPVALDGVPVHLMALSGGMTIPEHGHEGIELNLVLAGGFDDADEQSAYLPGDLSVKSSETVHTIEVHDDEDCIVLVVRSGKLVPQNLVGRLAQWLTGF